MTSLTLALTVTDAAGFHRQLDALRGLSVLDAVRLIHRTALADADRENLAAAVHQILLGAGPLLPPDEQVRFIPMESYLSGPATDLLLDSSKTDYLLLLVPGNPIEIGQEALERLVRVAEDWDLPGSEA
jgi:hypothetical protein